jgi:hypothetical protein
LQLVDADVLVHKWRSCINILLTKLCLQSRKPPLLAGNIESKHSSNLVGNPEQEIFA